LLDNYTVFASHQASYISRSRFGGQIDAAGEKKRHVRRVLERLQCGLTLVIADRPRGPSETAAPG
jgi:hypothetical protein